MTRETKLEAYVFRLYVAGNAPNSLQAIDNLTQLCDTHLPDRHEIEIVDICVDPGRALAESIYMTPTLVVVSPYPGHRIVGTLSNTEPILQILGLGPANEREFPGLKDRNSAPQVRRPS
ncbi:MAG TPA: circadian clock KaiB family protein [Thermoanaerobaculia bacterium]|nr:circadian clock KaiB family protein [Thermoanaerobaculia bacterium]